VQKNYKNTINEFETNGDMTLMTILKKDGTPLVAKIDTSDLDKVKECGIWFAEWHKDFNSYLVQNISSNKLNPKNKPLKQSLQTIIMDTLASTHVKHINGDTLDNRKSNLAIFDRNEKNKIEMLDDDTAAILLKDKHGNIDSKALISIKDLEKIKQYTWVNHTSNGKSRVVANTPQGRIYLDNFLLNPSEHQKVHHINLNPLDNRRNNIELKAILN